MNSSPSIPPERRETIASLRNVTKTFDSYLSRAVAGISFEVRRGEILGLIGPTGSGKSTLLRILAGRLRPTEGKVKVFGRSASRLCVRKRIGYLPGALSPAAAKSISHVLRQILSRFQKAPKDLAFGSSPRPALASAILGSREFLILDDAFAGLDPAHCLELKEMLLSMAQAGKTIVLSSASLLETKDICSRLAIIDEGRIQATGSLDQLLAAPNAIHLLASVLPPKTAELVREIIREDLCGNSTAAQSAAKKTAVPSSTIASTMAPTPASNASESAPDPLSALAEPEQTRQQPATLLDTVDHEKLHALTKPPGA